MKTFLKTKTKNQSQSQIHLLGTGDTPVTPHLKPIYPKTHILKQNTGDNVISSRYLYLLVLVLIGFTVIAQDRFPSPEFQGGYVIPENDFGGARSVVLYYIDVVVLFVALCMASYFVFKKRSRRGVMVVALFSLAYFGFYKQGCVCSLGAIQNVTAAIFSDYRLSITIFLIFALPLIFALFFGRVFCSGVCPIGALQEFVAVKPKKVPALVNAPLKIIPHIYLGIMILFVATGAGFPVCKLDPFAGIFRLSAPTGMMLLGAGMLALGIFVARPYCRYICPYGLLLGWTSLLSKYRVNTCSDTCVNCRLCESSCPVDAIRPPTTEPVKELRSRSVKRLKIYIFLLPVWIAAGAVSGWILSEPVSSLHPDVKLLRLVEPNQSALESEALRINANVIATLQKKTTNAKTNFKWGLIILGAYIGTVIGIYLIRQSTYKKRNCHDANPTECLTCARCYGYCPKEIMSVSIQN